MASMREAHMQKPTALPGWPVGHVLTHVARNADSHRRRTEAATRNEMIDQYRGGYEGREAEIEAGASPPATPLIDDVPASAAPMEAAWRNPPESALPHITANLGRS